MTAPVAVWFNKGFSSVYSVFCLIRDADVARQFRIICTHTNPEFIGFLSCDTAGIEPLVEDDAEYLNYCLEFCAREGVRLFMPGRRMAYLADHQQAFAEIGVGMIVAADTATQQMLEDKAALYQRLAEESIVPIPDYAVIKTLADFDQAVETLRAKHETICVKPNIGINGSGFRILTRQGREIDRILSGESIRISQAHFRSLLAEAESCRPLMIMQYLEGDERSVDCLADHGSLLRCVVRLKSARGNGAQLLEDNPGICQMTANLTRLLGLHGLFNVQYKESGGLPYLLEINARMSGGLPYACQSGVNLPYWALKLALAECTPDDIPYPQTGIRVAQMMTGVVVGNTKIYA